MDDLGEVVDVDNKGGVMSCKGERADKHEHLVEHIDASEEMREARQLEAAQSLMTL